MHPVASPLFAAVDFNVMDGIVVDRMHVLCLGVVRSLIEKWLYSSLENYFIGGKVMIPLLYCYSLNLRLG
jgi:hypothetical protein